jgi:DNA mismatch repair protein MSH6
MKNQKSILGFFQKSSPAAPSNDKPREPASSPAQRAGEQRGVSAVKPTPKRSFSSFAQDLTPVPSSDLPIPEDDEENADKVKVRLIPLLFPISSPLMFASPLQSGRDEIQDTAMSPSRRVCQLHKSLSHRYMKLTFVQAKKKQVSYKESDSEGEDDDDVIFRPSRKSNANGRAAKRRKTSPDSEDEFQEAGEAGYSDDGKQNQYFTPQTMTDRVQKWTTLLLPMIPMKKLLHQRNASDQLPHPRERTQIMQLQSPHPLPPTKTLI